MATVDQVGTLADLRNIIPDPNLVRFIKGRTAAGDAGAGIFEWDPNYPAVPDDGATIIKPNSSSSSWSSSSPGRWIRQVDVPANGAPNSGPTLPYRPRPTTKRSRQPCPGWRLPL
ncbi:MAG: hypothetical protein FJ387_31015 [Verrucomicrobia bacterium]|nr:hypothetical protein [Verrucomicrobiota bacterium]